MKLVWVLFKKDWRRFWGDKVAVMLTFLVPFFIIYLMGNIFGISPKKADSGGGGPTGIPLAVVDQSGSAVAAAMIDALDEDKAFRVIRSREDPAGQDVPLSEADVRAGIVNNDYRYALVFPEDAFSRGMGFRVKLLQNPRNQIETQTTEGLIQKNLMMAFFENIVDLPFLKEDPEIVKKWIEPLTELISEQFGISTDEAGSFFREDSFAPDIRRMLSSGMPAADASADGPDPDEDASDDLLGAMMNIEKERVVGKAIRNPQGVLIVSGYSVMFMLFTLTGISTSLFEEKQAGIFLRLLTSPATRAHILWSRYLFGICMGMVQLCTMFLASWIIFRVEIFHNFGNLLAAMLFVSMTCTALGMLLSAISKTPAQANGIGTLVIISMSAIGGAWFPVSFMGETIQFLSRFTLVYWSMEALLRTAFEGKGILEILPVLGVLTLMAAAFIGLSLWRFRKGDLF
jgi:ABC-2 type transport system permease protein